MIARRDNFLDFADQVLYILLKPKYFAGGLKNDSGALPLPATDSY